MNNEACGVSYEVFEAAVIGRLELSGYDHLGILLRTSSCCFEKPHRGPGFSG